MPILAFPELYESNPVVTRERLEEVIGLYMYDRTEMLRNAMDLAELVHDQPMQPVWDPASGQWSTSYPEQRLFPATLLYYQHHLWAEQRLAPEEDIAALLLHNTRRDCEQSGIDLSPGDVGQRIMDLCGPKVFKYAEGLSLDFTEMNSHEEKVGVLVLSPPLLNLRYAKGRINLYAEGDTQRAIEYYQAGQVLRVWPELLAEYKQGLRDLFGISLPLKRRAVPE